MTDAPEVTLPSHRATEDGRCTHCWDAIRVCNGCPTYPRQTTIGRVYVSTIWRSFAPHGMGEETMVFRIEEDGSKRLLDHMDSHVEAVAKWFGTDTTLRMGFDGERLQDHIDEMAEDDD